MNVGKPMFVYMLASKTRRLYVGVTNDLVRRVHEHRAGLIPGFTRRYGIQRLVYFEHFDGPERAITREKQIKGYARVKKLSLIESENPSWDDLAKDWFSDVRPPDPPRLICSGQALAPLGMTRLPFVRPSDPPRLRLSAPVTPATEHPALTPHP